MHVGALVAAAAACGAWHLNALSVITNQRFDAVRQTPPTGSPRVLTEKTLDCRRTYVYETGCDGRLGTVASISLLCIFGRHWLGVVNGNGFNTDRLRLVMGKSILIDSHC